MLAGHQGVIASIIHRCVSRIARGVDGVLSQDPEVAIDMQAAGGIALAVYLLRQWRGLHADGPDHGTGFDTFAVVESHPLFIDHRYRTAEFPGHTERVAGFGDHRGNLLAHDTADLFAHVDDDDADLGFVTQDGAQPRRHFGGRFDTGKASAHDHHGVACPATGLMTQALQVNFELLRRFQAVDIEGEAVDTGQRRTGDLTARGENQPVVDQRRLPATGTAVEHLPALRIDTGGATLHELYADCIEQRAERGDGGRQVGFIEARAYMQFGLWGEEGDRDIPALMLLQQANGAQCAPHAAETGTNDQNLLFHIL